MGPCYLGTGVSTRCKPKGPVPTLPPGICSCYRNHGTSQHTAKLSPCPPPAPAGSCEFRHTSGMCNPWSCQFFGQTKPECHNYRHIPKYWHNHKNTKNVHGWHNTPNKTQSNGLRAGLGSWPHGVHRAMAMLCILHDLWRPWVRAVAAIVPHVGGSIVQKPTVGFPQKIFCAFMGH